MPHIRKLLIGGQGHITAVIIIKWYRRSRGVAGVVELWRLDVNGNPLKEQDAVIFPEPPRLRNLLFMLPVNSSSGQPYSQVVHHMILSPYIWMTSEEKLDLRCWNKVLCLSEFPVHTPHIAHIRFQGTCGV